MVDLCRQLKCSKRATIKYLEIRLGDHYFEAFPTNHNWEIMDFSINRGHLCNSLRLLFLLDPNVPSRTLVYCRISYFGRAFKSFKATVKLKEEFHNGKDIEVPSQIFIKLVQSQMISNSLEQNSLSIIDLISPFGGRHFSS